MSEPVSEHDETDEAPAARAARAERRTRRDRALILIGALVVVAGAAVALALWLRPGDGGGDDAVAPSSNPRYIRVMPTAAVRPGTVLRWSATPGAARYAVEAFSADGMPAWRAESTTPELAWPVAGAATLPGSYRYRITALSAERLPLAMSSTLDVLLVAPPPATPPAPPVPAPKP